MYQFDIILFDKYTLHFIPLAYVMQSIFSLDICPEDFLISD